AAAGDLGRDARLALAVGEGHGLARVWAGRTQEQHGALVAVYADHVIFQNVHADDPAHVITAHVPHPAQIEGLNLPIGPPAGTRRIVVFPPGVSTPMVSTGSPSGSELSKKETVQPVSRMKENSLSPMRTGRMSASPLLATEKRAMIGVLCWSFFSPALLPLGS